MDVGSRFFQEFHDYPDMLIRLTLFHCTIASGVPQLLEHKALRWIRPEEIPSYKFCPADVNVLAQIRREYEGRPPL